MHHAYLLKFRRTIKVEVSSSPAYSQFGGLHLAGGFDVAQEQHIPVVLDPVEVTDYGVALASRMGVGWFFEGGEIISDLFPNATKET